MPAKKPNTKPRFATGSLRGMSARQLVTFQAQVRKAIKARWLTDNPVPIRSKGRPSKRDEVADACAKVRRTMLRRKEVSLGDWYDTVAAELRSRGLNLSLPTVKKFTKEWMGAHLSIDILPVGIGPYLIQSRNDFKDVHGILIWGALCQQFPEIQRWLKNRQRQSLPFLNELPHAILPKILQEKINTRSHFPLGPRLYDHLVREILRNTPEQ